MPQNILQAILETKRKEVDELRRRVQIEELIERARAADRPRNFFSAVTRRTHRRANLIAEVKKAFPLRGRHLPRFRPPP